MPANEPGGEDAALLTLAQWLSPAFPLGAFAWSQGLEQAVAEGAVTDATGLERWLDAVLRTGAGRADAVLLCAAMSAVADADALAATARALAPSAERWAETREQGAAFVRTLAGMGGPRLPACALPVAVGLAAADLGLRPDRVAALWLHSVAGGLVTVAVRHVPLGQTQGQAVLARLAPACREVAAEAARTAPADIAASTPGAELIVMAHETAEVRLFRS